MAYKLCINASTYNAATRFEAQNTPRQPYGVLGNNTGCLWFPKRCDESFLHRISSPTSDSPSWHGYDVESGGKAITMTISQSNAEDWRSKCSSTAAHHGFVLDQIRFS